MRRPREKLLFDTAGSIVTPMQDLDGIITRTACITFAATPATPAIDPDQHRLMIHGMVDRPLSFSMENLMRFPSISAVHFLECSGNTALNKEATIKPGWTVQDTHGLLSFAEWTGVRLADVLAEAGVQPGAPCHGAGGEHPISPSIRLTGGKGTLTKPNAVQTVGSYWPYATTL